MIDHVIFPGEILLQVCHTWIFKNRPTGYEPRPGFLVHTGGVAGTDRVDDLMVTSHLGNGLAFIVGSPLVRNQWIGNKDLSPVGDNQTVARNLVNWLTSAAQAPTVGR